MQDSCPAGDDSVWNLHTSNCSHHHKGGGGGQGEEERGPGASSYIFPPGVRFVTLAYISLAKTGHMAILIVREVETLSPLVYHAGGGNHISVKVTVVHICHSRHYLVATLGYSPREAAPLRRESTHSLTQSLPSLPGS